MDKYKHRADGSRSSFSSNYHGSTSRRDYSPSCSDREYKWRESDTAGKDYHRKKSSREYSSDSHHRKESHDHQQQQSCDNSSPGSQMSAYSFTSKTSITKTPEDEIQPYMVVDLRMKAEENERRDRMNGSNTETIAKRKQSGTGISRTEKKQSKWKNAFVQQLSLDTEDNIVSDSKDIGSDRDTTKNVDTTGIWDTTKNNMEKVISPGETSIVSKVEPYVVEDIRVSSSDDERHRKSAPITRISTVKRIERGLYGGLYSEINLPKQSLSQTDTFLSDRFTTTKITDVDTDDANTKTEKHHQSSRSPTAKYHEKEIKQEKEQRRSSVDVGRTRKNSEDSDRRSVRDSDRRRTSGDKDRRRPSGSNGRRRPSAGDGDRRKSSSSRESNNKRRTSSDNHTERNHKEPDRRNQQQVFKDRLKFEEQQPTTTLYTPTCVHTPTTVYTPTTTVYTPTDAHAPDIASNLQILEQQLAAMQSSSSAGDVNTQKVLLLKYQQALLAQNINTLCMLNVQQASVNYLSHPGGVVAPSSSSSTSDITSISLQSSTPSPVITPNLASADYFNFAPPPQPPPPVTGTTPSNVGSTILKSPLMSSKSPLVTKSHAMVAKKSPSAVSPTKSLFGSSSKKEKTASHVVPTDQWRSEKESSKHQQQHQQMQKSQSLLRKFETSTDNMTTEQLLLKMKKYQNQLSHDELMQLKNALDKKVEKTRKLKEELKLLQSQKQPVVSVEQENSTLQPSASLKQKRSAPQLSASLEQERPAPTDTLNSPSTFLSSSTSKKANPKSKGSYLPDLNLPFVDQTLKKNSVKVKPRHHQTPPPPPKPKVIPRGILLKADGVDDVKTEDLVSQSTLPPPSLLETSTSLVSKTSSSPSVLKTSTKEKNDGRKLSFKEYQKRKIGSGGASEGVTGSSKNPTSIEDEYLAFLMSIGDDSTVKQEDASNLTQHHDIDNKLDIKRSPSSNGKRSPLPTQNSTAFVKHSLSSSNKHTTTDVKLSYGLQLELETVAHKILSSAKEVKNSGRQVLQQRKLLADAPNENKARAPSSTNVVRSSTAQSQQLQGPRKSNLIERTTLQNTSAKDIPKHEKITSKKSPSKVLRPLKDKPSYPPAAAVAAAAAVKKGFSCGECGYSFSSFVDLEIHVNEKHTNVETINKIDINPHNSIRVDRSKPKVVKKPILSHFAKIDNDVFKSTENPDRIKVYYPKKLLDNADKEKNKASTSAASKEGFGNKSSDKLKADMAKLLAKSEHHHHSQQRKDLKKEEKNKTVDGRNKTAADSQNKNTLFTKEGILKVKETVTKHSEQQQPTKLQQQQQHVKKVDSTADKKHTKHHNEKHSELHQHNQRHRKDLEHLKEEAHRKRLKAKKKKKHKLRELEEDDKHLHKHGKHKHRKSSSESPKKSHSLKDRHKVTKPENQHTTEEVTHGVGSVLSQSSDINNGDGSGSPPNPLLDNLTQIVTGKRQSKLTQRKKAFMEALKARQARRRRLKDFTLETNDGTPQSSFQKVKVLKSSNLIKAKEVIMKSKKVKRVIQNEKLARINQKENLDANSSSVENSMFSPASVVRAGANTNLEQGKTKRIALHQQVESVFKAIGNQQHLTQIKQPLKLATTTLKSQNDDAKLSLGKTSLTEEQLENIFNRVQSKHSSSTAAAASQPILIDTESAIPLVTTKVSPKGSSSGRRKSSSTTDEDDNTTIKALKYKIEQAERTARKLIRSQKKGSGDAKVSSVAVASSGGGPLKVKLHIKMADFVSETTALLTKDTMYTAADPFEHERDEKQAKVNNKKGGKKRKGGKRKTPQNNNKSSSDPAKIQQQPKRKRNRYYVYEYELLAQKQRQLFDDSHDSGVGGSFSSSVNDYTLPDYTTPGEHDSYSVPDDLEYDKEYDYNTHKEEEVFLTADVLLSSLLTLTDVGVDEQNMKEMEGAFEREIQRDVSYKLDQLLDNVSDNLEAYDISKGYRQPSPPQEVVSILDALVKRVDETVKDPTTSTTATTTAEISTTTTTAEISTTTMVPLELKLSMVHGEREQLCTPPPSPDHDYFNFKNQLSSLQLKSNSIGYSKLDHPKSSVNNESDVHFCKEDKQEQKSSISLEGPRKELSLLLSADISSNQHITTTENVNNQRTSNGLAMQCEEKLPVGLLSGTDKSGIQATMDFLLAKVDKLESLPPSQPAHYIQKNASVDDSNAPLLRNASKEDNIRKLLDEICDSVAGSTITCDRVLLDSCETSPNHQLSTTSTPDSLLLYSCTTSANHQMFESLTTNTTNSKSIELIVKDLLSDIVNRATKLRKENKMNFEESNPIKPGDRGTFNEHAALESIKTAKHVDEKRQSVKRTIEHEIDTQSNKLPRTETTTELSNSNGELRNPLSLVQENTTNKPSTKDGELRSTLSSMFKTNNKLTNNNGELGNTPPSGFVTADEGESRNASPPPKTHSKDKQQPSPEELEKLERKRQRILLSHQKNAIYITNNIANNIHIKTEPEDYPEVDVQLLDDDDSTVADEFKLDVLMLHHTQNTQNILPLEPTSATLLCSQFQAPLTLAGHYPEAIGPLAKQHPTVTSPGHHSEAPELVPKHSLGESVALPTTILEPTYQRKSYSCDNYLLDNVPGIVVPTSEMEYLKKRSMTPNTTVSTISSSDCASSGSSLSEPTYSTIINNSTTKTTIDPSTSFPTNSTLDSINASTTWAGSTEGTIQPNNVLAFYSTMITSPTLVNSSATFPINSTLDTVNILTAPVASELGTTQTNNIEQSLTASVKRGRAQKRDRVSDESTTSSFMLDNKRQCHSVFSVEVFNDKKDQVVNPGLVNQQQQQQNSNETSRLVVNNTAASVSRNTLKYHNSQTCDDRNNLVIFDKNSQTTHKNNFNHINSSPPEMLCSKNSNTKLVENQFSKCHLCSLCFKSRESMKHHVLTQHNGLLFHDTHSCFKCKTCRQTFTTKKLLLRHTLLRHAKDTSGYKCNVCGRTFLRPFYLKSHQKSHRKSDKLPVI